MAWLRNPLYFVSGYCAFCLVLQTETSDKKFKCLRTFLRLGFRHFRSSAFFRESPLILALFPISEKPAPAWSSWNNLHIIIFRCSRGKQIQSSIRQRDKITKLSLQLTVVCSLQCVIPGSLINNSTSEWHWMYTNDWEIPSKLKDSSLWVWQLLK